MDGIIRFASPAENRILITFDDRKTDPEKITQALVLGGVVIPGKSKPASETPFSYFPPL
jgi:hypothetical protein